jgi:hypothetical protein
VIRDLAHVNEYIVHLDRLGVVVRTVDRVPAPSRPSVSSSRPGLEGRVRCSAASTRQRAYHYRVNGGADVPLLRAGVRR